jgi:phosphatidylglycerol:prolipoprotein diacylglycerol transferase
MYPKLLELPWQIPVIGQITLYTYGLLLAAAYLLGLKLAMVRARTRGLDHNRVLDLGIYIIISALIGAKLLLLVTDYRTFRADPGELLTLARSGGVFYGGLIAAVTVALIYLRRHRLPLWTTTDVFAPGIALGHVVGRMGCLLAGCCFGRPTSVPWAITFTDPVAAANVGTPLGVPLHPTQLYEAGAELLILVFLLLWERRDRGFPGRTFWSYMLLYGLSRFVIEFYRGDSRGMVLNALSTSQFVSIILVPLSIVMLFLLSRHVDPTRHAAAQRAAA